MKYDELVINCEILRLDDIYNKVSLFSKLTNLDSRPKRLIFKNVRYMTTVCRRMIERLDLTSLVMVTTIT